MNDLPLNAPVLVRIGATVCHGPFANATPEATASSASAVATANVGSKPPASALPLNASIRDSSPSPSTCSAKARSHAPPATLSAPSSRKVSGARAQARHPASPSTACSTPHRTSLCPPFAVFQTACGNSSKTEKPLLHRGGFLRIGESSKTQLLRKHSNLAAVYVVIVRTTAITLEGCLSFGKRVVDMLAIVLVKEFVIPICQERRNLL